MTPEDSRKIKELELTLAMAIRTYNAGKPVITDQEFDQTWRELAHLDPNNKNLYHTSREIITDAVTHIHTIPGLQKAFDTKELSSFLERFKGEILTVEPKYDGVAAIYYNRANQDQLVLTGDGTTGRDITHHLQNISFRSPPWHCCTGELIIPMAKWNPEFGKNPRNTVAGWISRAQIPEPNYVLFIPHDAAHHGMEIPMAMLNDQTALAAFLMDCYLEWSALVPMDGLVIKVKDSKRRLVAGHTAYFHWSIAWKPPIQTIKTTVTAVHWNISRQGRIIPTVEYTPVELCGTTNSMATGNNAQWIIQRTIAPGTIITIGKAGEIIPRIVAWENPPAWRKVQYAPTYCPACGAMLFMDSVHLICNNEDCFPRQVQKLYWFYTPLCFDLDSIGPGACGKLLSDPDLYPILVDHPWALIVPEHFNIIGKITAVLGNALTRQYLNNLSAIQGKRDPSHFVGSLGLPNLNRKNTMTIWQHVKYGSKLTRNPQNFLNSFLQGLTIWKRNEAYLTAHFDFAPLPPPATLFYAITGQLSVPRKDMQDYLHQYGWTMKNFVSKDVSLLILGNTTKLTNKQVAAKNLKVPIITEAELPKYLNPKEKIHVHNSDRRQELHNKTDS